MKKMKIVSSTIIEYLLTKNNNDWQTGDSDTYKEIQLLIFESEPLKYPPSFVKLT